MNIKEMIQRSKIYSSQSQQMAYQRGFKDACHLVSMAINAGTLKQEDIDKIAYSDVIDLTEVIDENNVKDKI